MGAELNKDELSIAFAAIELLAPDEVEYCRDLASRPPLWKRTANGSSIGFGANEVLEVVSPYVLVGAGWVGSVIFDEVKDIGEERIRALIRRMFGRPALERLHAAQPKGVRSQADMAHALSELGLKRKDSERLAEVLMDVARRKRHRA